MGLMGRSFVEVLATAQVDGTANTTGAAASCIPTQAKYGLPANYFDFIGRKVQIKASGRVSSVITTPGTMRFDVRMGGTVVFDSLAVLLDVAAAHVNVPWFLDIELTARVVGSVAQLFGQGTLGSEAVKGFGTAPVGFVVAGLPWNTAPALGGTFDATVGQTVDLFFTQTVATGSLTLHEYELVSKN